MGMLHAKCLSANKQFKESEAVLSKLNIIPLKAQQTVMPYIMKHR